MITVKKYLSLPPPTRLRKLWRLVSQLEMGLRGPDAPGAEVSALLGFLRGLPLSEFGAAGQAAIPALREPGGDAAAALRAANDLRHALGTLVGHEAAEWDLLPPLQSVDGALATRPGQRRVVYCDSIRSPFNAGSIFRTASAFNFDLLVISPDCPDPGHPRFSRSAMGSLEFLPWKRGELATLLRETGLPVFALELGGSPLQTFAFPEAGIVVLGSEELGVRPEILETCRGSCGVVSIPLPGPKASLNVGVSFGIVAAAWTAAVG